MVARQVVESGGCSPLAVPLFGVALSLSRGRLSAQSAARARDVRRRRTLRGVGVGVVADGGLSGALALMVSMDSVDHTKKTEHTRSTLVA